MTRPVILVTGGAGYIGSHAVRALQQAGYTPVVLDNLVYGHRRILDDVLRVPLVVGQVGDRALLDQLLSGQHPATDGLPIQAVLHFAAYAYVGESMTDPSKYYRNNVVDSLALLEALKAEGERVHCRWCFPAPVPPMASRLRIKSLLLKPARSSRSIPMAAASGWWSR